MTATIDFAGQTVLVTGGTRGIGAAIATEFELAGAARVILTGRSAEAVAGLNEEVERTGRSAVTYVHADFSDADSTARFLGYLGELERIDVCVNNAGVNRIVPVEDIDAETFDWIWSVNTRAPMLVMSAVAPIMRRQAYGRIVNIASIWATVTKAGRAMYTSSKFAVVGMTKAAAVELAPWGVLANAVSPGFTRTELTASTLSPSEMEALAALVPMGRFAEPQEIARVVLFLGSGFNTYLTGQNVTVDGGYVST